MKCAHFWMDEENPVKKVTHLLPSEKARRGDIERLKTVDREDRVFQTFPLFKTEM